MLGSLSDNSVINSLYIIILKCATGKDTIQLCGILFYREKDQKQQWTLSRRGRWPGTLTAPLLVQEHARQKEEVWMWESHNLSQCLNLLNLMAWARTRTAQNELWCKKVSGEHTSSDNFQCSSLPWSSTWAPPACRLEIHLHTWWQRLCLAQGCAGPACGWVAWNYSHWGTTTAPNSNRSTALIPTPKYFLLLRSEYFSVSIPGIYKLCLFAS